MGLSDNGHEDNKAGQWPKCAYCKQVVVFPFAAYKHNDDFYCSRGCFEMAGMAAIPTNTSSKQAVEDMNWGKGLADIVRDKNLPAYDLDARPELTRGQTPPDPSWSDLVSLRPSVAWFAAQMEMKLRKYDDEKDGWEHCTFNHLFSALKGEIAELRDAWGPFGLCEDDTLSDLKDKVVEEAADIANYAMMIADTAARWAARQEEYWQHYESTP